MSDLATLRQAVLDATLNYAIEHTAPAAVAAVTATAFNGARSAYQTALAAEPVLWADTAPTLLTPVRLECRYLPPDQAGGPPILGIRVIPDTVGRYQFDTDLSADELAAAQSYWATIATPGADVTAAWTTVQHRLGDARGAWALETTRPKSSVNPTGTRTTVAPATSLLLPDKFTFRGWRDATLVFQQDGLPITATDIALGPDFSQLGGTSDDPTELAWTDKSKWMVDFAAAVAAGMAIKIPLPGPNLALDTITVVGVSGCPSDEGANRWARTLQGHLYTDGLGYPPVGAPTNNTDASRSQWTTRPTLRSPDDVTAAVDKAVPQSGQPGVALADAFGLPTDTAPATPGRRDLLAAPDGTSRDDDDLPAQAYQLMADYYFLLTDADPNQRTGWLTTDARCQHFARHVRADGPLPVLRIGRQPYGVLPVTSLLAWAPAPEPDLPADLVDQILLRQALLNTKLGFSPRLSPYVDEDQDAVLLSLLQRQPGAVHIQSMPSSVPGSAPATLPVFPSGQIFTYGTLVPSCPVFDVTSAAADAQPTDPTSWPLAAMSTATGVSTLAELQQSAQQTSGAATTLRSLLGAGADPAGLTSGGLYWVLQAIAAARWIAACSVTQSADQWHATSADIATTLAPLRTLEGTADRAGVDRELAAAAAALSHRLDGWATSVATARLRAARGTAPTGIHLGMYGWLSDIEPMADELRTADNGWALTPSVQHAVTAAALFAGAQAHSSTAFDIDLSSARVRGARTALAELRNGSTLEEILGYQLERALHDQHFDTAIPALRATYPLPITATAVAGATDTGRAARLVTNGDAVRQAPDRGAVTNLITAALPPLPQAAAARAQAITAILDGLDDTVDAVGDVLMAESVHHLVGGSPLRAGLAADVIGKAAAPPDPLSAISTPTSAVSVTQTLALAVTVPTTSSWPSRPRAALDPAAEVVAQWSFGSSGDWQATITPAGTSTTQLVPLADLDICALDVAVELTTPIDTSVFAARVRAHAGAAPDAAVAMTRTDGHGGANAAVQLAAAVRTVLSRCRGVASAAAALTPGADTAVTADLAGLSTRISTWWDSVQQVLTGWTPADAASAAAALEQLSLFGLAGARIDASAATAADLHDRWAGLPVVPPLGTDTPTSGQATDWLAGAATALRKAAGDWVTPAPSDDAVSAGWGGLPGVTPTVGADDDDVADWLRQLATVSSGVAALADLLALSGACGAAESPEWLLRQQLGDSTVNGPWVATSHPGNRSANALTCLRIGDDAPGTNHVLLVLDQWSETVPLRGRQPATGAAVPDPDPHQEAALALRYDSPDSRAPQALLLVTPPDPARGWRAEDLCTAVEETLWWSMARPIDILDDPDQGANY